MKPLDRELSDGTIRLRRPLTGDRALIIAARDAEFRRFLGEGSADPEPTAVVVDDRHGTVLGWIDYDVDRSWLGPGAVNIGYTTFPDQRRRGVASRAVELLVEWLGDQDEFTTATLLIDPANTASLRVAACSGFTHEREVDGQLLFKRSLRSRRRVF